MQESPSPARGADPGQRPMKNPPERQEAPTPRGQTRAPTDGAPAGTTRSDGEGDRGRPLHPAAAGAWLHGVADRNECPHRRAPMVSCRRAADGDPVDPADHAKPCGTVASPATTDGRERPKTDRHTSRRQGRRQSRTSRRRSRTKRISCRQGRTPNRTHGHPLDRTDPYIHPTATPYETPSHAQNPAGTRLLARTNRS